MVLSQDEIVGEAIRLLGGSVPLQYLEWDTTRKFVPVGDCENRPFVEMFHHFLENKYYECKREECPVCKMFVKGMKAGDSNARDLRQMGFFVFVAYDRARKVYYPIRIPKIAFERILKYMAQEIEVCKYHAPGMPPVGYNVKLIDKQVLDIPNADFSLKLVNTGFHKIDDHILEKLKNA